MRIVIATVQVPFVRGGAEFLAESLCAECQRAGHDAEIVSVPTKGYPVERVLDEMLASRLIDLSESCGERIDLMIGLKFPAYLMQHQTKVMWVLHQHRAAYDLWEAPGGDLHASLIGRHVREVIHTADQRACSESRGIYTISKNISARLKKYCDVDGTALYHPPADAEKFRPGGYGDYLLMPSRIYTLKRQDLVIDALELTQSPVRVCFIGAAQGPDSTRQFGRRIAASPACDRMTWLGAVSQERKIELYADCTAVVFPPVDEDYGYVTLEAMLAGKPVVTCRDSGGPLEFVVDERTGIVCEPTPQALAAAMDRLWEERSLARTYGEAARDHYAGFGMSWKRVLSCLLA